METGKRTWLITGASSGMGLEVVKAALNQGDNVVATYRALGALQPLTTDFAESLKTIFLDVTNPEQINLVVQEAVHAFGSIDVVFSNVGRALVGALEELSNEQIQQNISTNLMAHIYLAKAVIPHLRTLGKGRIIFNSAIAVYGNYAGFSVYGAAKYALEGLAESLKGELAPFGITVGLIYPGPTRTGFVSNSLDVAETSVPGYERTSGKFRSILKNLNGKQPGDPVKIAALIYESTRMENPPFRLFMGAYAHKKVKDRLLALQVDLDLYKDISLATDY